MYEFFYTTLLLRFNPGVGAKAVIPSRRECVLEAIIKPQSASLSQSC